MRVNTLQKFPFKRAEYPLRESLRRMTVGRLFLYGLCFFGVVLGLLPGTAGDIMAAGYDDSRTAADVDSRWLPWIGSWR
ncbi:MAG: hypothetical protein JXR49_12665, partial [Acidobacteria bacterium]|nr:hypothetical protein [Acidobacteriota bacterium]